MRFLGSLTSAMPFDRKPELTKPEIALRLLVASEGLVGILMNLILHTTTLAIEDGLSTFGMKTLSEAFAAIEKVGAAENPFEIEACNEKSYAEIRKRIAARRARINEANRKAAVAAATLRTPTLTKN